MGEPVGLREACRVLARRAEHLTRRIDDPKLRESSKHWDRAERAALRRVLAEVEKGHGPLDAAN